MKVRQVQKSDLETVVAIEQAGFSPAEAASASTFAARIENMAETFLVAVADQGQVCGLVTTTRYVEDWMYEAQAKPISDGKYLNILSIAVAPEKRGQKLGSALLTALEEVAKAKEISSLSLTCLADRIGFYERNGYHNQGQSASTHANEVWYDMEKIISKKF
ncbi:GNAT family N-acetyltransferase [Ligilactobacillus agilis]|uniref:GNAT family N-acetyltransferase n=1 Tax=Ligilactobacillus agilis TaxID=1601 RepID=UPI0018684FD8|nr:N-acetyltransferase [Ligilactobacillus agilis]